jgi:anti-anti-sigma factor
MEPVDDGAQAAINSAVDERGGRVISISGEIDISTVPAIEARLQTLIEGAVPPLTFDLSSLAFMDSSGIAMLLRAVDKTGPVVIRKPSKTMQQVIRATGLSEVLRVES